MKARELFRLCTTPLGLFVLGAAICLGCENKEKVLEVEGPAGGEIQLERNRDTGEVDVDVHDADDKILDIDTPGADVEVQRGDGVDVDVDAD